MTGRPWTWRERGAYASVITLCVLVLCLSVVVGCGNTPRPVDPCDEACNEARELVVEERHERTG